MSPLINNINSTLLPVSSGGSLLGPLLFLFYISDLPPITKFSDSLSFAYNTKLFKYTTNLTHCYHLQDSVDSVLEWGSLNDLSLSMYQSLPISDSQRIQLTAPTPSHSLLAATQSTLVNLIKDLGILPLLFTELAPPLLQPHLQQGLQMVRCNSPLILPHYSPQNQENTVHDLSQRTLYMVHLFEDLISLTTSSHLKIFNNVQPSLSLMILPLTTKLII